MKSLLSILSAILKDASRTLGANTSADEKTISRRLEHEGEGFLYLTLPTFGSWFEQSLDLGVIQTSIFTTFRRKPKATGSVLPCFLQGLTSLVFDERTGFVRKKVNKEAVFFVRQICYLLKKPSVIASPERDAKAHRAYEETDSSILKPSTIVSACDWYVRETALILLRDFRNAYAQASDTLPKHGPGATADRLRGNAKFTCRDWYSRWNRVFHHEDLYGYTVEVEEDLKSIGTRSEMPVKVISVPKTYKTSRIISVEPTAMQYAQQYVAAKMTYAIGDSDFAGVINLKDQTQNRDLARKGSIDGSLATIDLSEASDRVSCTLVRELFESCPEIRRELFAVRSSRAKLRDGRIIPIRKYASMGSATTFPVESVVFAIIAIAATAKTHHWAGTGRSFYQCVQKATTEVSVYGDDIIVPRTSFSETTALLEALGLKVNRGKSFAQGLFRESCGGDYYEGVDVTPAYCRTAAPQRLADAKSIASFVSLSNQLYEKGCWTASEAVKQVVENITGPLPLKTREASYLGWSTYQNVSQWARFDKNFTPQVRSYVIRSGKRKDPLDGYSALLKHQLSADVQERPDHLSTSDERHSIRLRRQWVAAL